MFGHHLKLARKALLKNKYYSIINIFGLVCGMLSTLIIAKYIGGSLHFDRFHSKKDNIYAILQQESVNGGPFKENRAVYSGAKDLISQYPEISQITKYNGHVESVVHTLGENGHKLSFVENKIFTADSGFLQIFSFPLIQGDSATAMNRAHSVVLTRTSAGKYFGNTNPIGEVITIRVPWGQETEYEVTGVVEDLPLQSQFKFDFLLTQNNADPGEKWLVPDCSIFVLLKSNHDQVALHTKLESALAKVEPLKETNRQVNLSMESITKTKLSGMEYLLIAVGLFILLISWINYINQIIAQSYLRTKEIGVLRVLGSTHRNLNSQFSIECSLICLTALALVSGLYLILEPYLQSFTNGHLLPLTSNVFQINLIFLSIFALGLLTAALIPGLILFSSHLATNLRNGFENKIAGFGLRKSLVILQFSISAIMMISIFIISKQLDFMSNKGKGISMENILIVKDPISNDTSWNQKRKTQQLFKEKCAQLPFVTAVSSSTTVPGDEYRHEVYFSFKDQENKAMVHVNGVDDRFFELYQVKFAAGHNFIPNARWENRKSIIINESAARAMGISDLDNNMGSKIYDQESEREYNLIGIVKDYHQTSLKYEIKPMAFQFNELVGHFSLHIHSESLATDQISGKINNIKKIWSEVYPESAFDTFLLDDKFAAQDAEDRYFGQLFKYFTGLSIIISCLGLFGLSLMISTRRQKEIGIRKTLGASTLNILNLFLKGYLGSILISILVGYPLAYMMMSYWLKNYTYRVEIGFWPVFAAILSLAGVFLFTVSYHTIKSSLINPVKILRA